MQLPLIVRQKIHESTGIVISQVKGVESLSEYIVQKTGDRIGYTTLRRLYGLIDDERIPRTNTLDIIAHFLDYENWEQMMREICPSDSSFLNPGRSILLSELKEGSIVEIKYFPNRTLLLESAGDHRFKVIESLNSKLQTGDIAVIDDILLHFPMHARSVIRDGVNLGRYIAGEQYGISSIRIIQCHPSSETAA